MSLLGAESCNIYGTADIPDYWTASNQTFVVSGVGRCGENVWGNFSLGGGPWMNIASSDPYKGWAGWAQHLLTTDANVIFGVTFTIGAFSGYGHVCLVANVNGSLNLRWSFGGLSYDVPSTYTAAGLVSAFAWHAYGMEWYVTPNNDGYCRVYLDGNRVIDYSGPVVTTLYPVWVSLQPPDQMRWFPHGYIQDMYWGDTAGSAPWNAYDGDKRCEGQLCLTDAAGGGGAHREFSLPTGTDHGENLNDSVPDDDTTVAQSSTVGHRETVKFPPIVLSSGSVHGIVSMPNMKKSISGTRSVRALSRTGSTTVETGTETFLNQATYLYNAHAVMQVDPVTTLPWTAATANAAEHGVIVKS